MAGQQGLTESDLLDALREARLNARSEEEGYLTSTEISDLLGVSVKTVLRLLRELAKAGQLDHRMVRRESLLTHRVYSTDAYRLREDE